MAKKQEAEPKELKTLLESVSKQKKSKGKLADWTDAVLLKTRDRLRKAARKHRGSWSLKFYDVLQEINKEGAKRNLPAKTD